MIKNNEPVSMAEASKYVDKTSETGKEVLRFIKKFTKLSPKDGEEMRQKLRELDLIKLNDMSISKIIDLLPDNADDLNKISTDFNLDEDETNKILDTVKQFK